MSLFVADGKRIGHSNLSNEEPLRSDLFRVARYTADVHRRGSLRMDGKGTMYRRPVQLVF